MADTKGPKPGAKASAAKPRAKAPRKAPAKSAVEEVVAEPVVDAPVAVASAIEAPEAEGLQARLAEAEARADAAEKALATATGEREAWSVQREALLREVTDLRQRKDVLSAELSEASALIAQLEGQRNMAGFAAAASVGLNLLLALFRRR